MADILEQWADGRLSTSLAIRAGQFDGFGELLEAALNSKVPLRTHLLDHEKAQVERFVEAMKAP